MWRVCVRVSEYVFTCMCISLYMYLEMRLQKSCLHNSSLISTRARKESSRNARVHIRGEGKLKVTWKVFPQLCKASKWSYVTSKTCFCYRSGPYCKSIFFFFFVFQFAKDCIFDWVKRIFLYLSSLSCLVNKQNTTYRRQRPGARRAASSPSPGRTKWPFWRRTSLSHLVF